MKETRCKVKITFRESVLGTVPKDPDVYAAHILSRAALTDEKIKEEISTVEKVEEKGWTGFHLLEDGTPFFYDYVIRGFFKAACWSLRRSKENKSHGIAAFKKIIDGLIFVFPRRIPININGGEMGILERPLRAETAKGPRVTVARSDSCPVGSTMEFEVILLAGSVSKAILEEWLNHGQYTGLGQWRNGGYGSFDYEIETK